MVNDINFWLCPIIGVTMIVVVLFRHFFSFSFRRDTPLDIPPAPLPVSAPVRSLIQPVEQEVFAARLKQVVASTELLMKDSPNGQWDNRSVFRRTWSIDSRSASLSDIGTVHWDLDIFHNADDILCLLVAAMKGREHVPPASWEDITGKGKIIAHEICTTMIDGASELASNGYVDVYDLPPIDTWIYLTPDTKTADAILYCWVPNPFVEAMKAAMDVSIVDNYQWADIAQLLPDYQH